MAGLDLKVFSRDCISQKNLDGVVDAREQVDQFCPSGSSPGSPQGTLSGTVSIVHYPDRSRSSIVGQRLTSKCWIALEQQPVRSQRSRPVASNSPLGSMLVVCQDCFEGRSLLKTLKK
jgi:hypothetical protein